MRSTPDPALGQPLPTRGTFKLLFSADRVAGAGPVNAGIGLHRGAEATRQSQEQAEVVPSGATGCHPDDQFHFGLGEALDIIHASWVYLS